MLLERLARTQQRRKSQKRSFNACIRSKRICHTIAYSEDSIGICSRAYEMIPLMKDNERLIDI